MKIIEGISYNLRGLKMGITTPKLLFWGLLRFLMVVIITILTASLIISFQQEILTTIWSKPESVWIVWLWYLTSWIFSLVLVAVAAVISYLLSQILFSVVIMDLMSRITEQKIKGTVQEPESMPLIKLFFHLIKQEIPRTIIPISFSLLLMLGSLTPLGPVLAMLSFGIAAVFLAWDNTDLLPARQLVVFRDRFRFLTKNLLFHLGFGLPFLIPGLNILFLCFAPVGATLVHLEKPEQKNPLNKKGCGGSLRTLRLDGSGLLNTGSLTRKAKLGPSAKQRVSSTQFKRISWPLLLIRGSRHPLIFPRLTSEPLCLCFHYYSTRTNLLRKWSFPSTTHGFG